MENTRKKELLELSRISPPLKYSPDLARILSSSSKQTDEILEAYFAAQPAEYIRELREFEQANAVPLTKERRVFVFVTAFNEEQNLSSLVQQYARQAQSFHHRGSEWYEVCFVLNYTENRERRENARLQERFEMAIDILLKEKRKHPFLHIISKVFSPEEGSLGRARKYGMDYCLWRARKQPCASLDQLLIVSNEGDMLSIPENYLSHFARHFKEGEQKFIQGKITYPSEIVKLCEPVRLFVHCREAVHLGQGRAGNSFPYFDGILPIGRNFAVSPKIYAQAGGIDPVRRKDTDDDMNFGTDIHVRVGERFKFFCDIPVVTNPRREVKIVRDILAGKKEDAKKSYEEFHENRELYDSSYEQIFQMSKALPSHILNREMECQLIQQYFQWMLISRYKARLSSVSNFAEIVRQHREHEISYWEKERQLCNAFQARVQNMSRRERLPLEKNIVSEAIWWFNHFMEPLGRRYSCTYEGLDSALR